MTLRNGFARGTNSAQTHLSLGATAKPACPSAGSSPVGVSVPGKDIFEGHPSRSLVARPPRDVFRTADLEYLNVIQISYKPKYSRVEGATRIFNEEESDVVPEDLSRDRYSLTVSTSVARFPLRRCLSEETGRGAEFERPN